MRVIENEPVERDIISEWLNGYTDSVGTVDYGPGHYIYMRGSDIDNGEQDKFYVLRTDSLGFTYLLEFFTEDAWNEHREMVETQYDVIEALDQTHI